VWHRIAQLGLGLGLVARSSFAQVTFVNDFESGSLAPFQLNNIFLGIDDAGIVSSAAHRGDAGLRIIDGHVATTATEEIDGQIAFTATPSAVTSRSRSDATATARGAPTASSLWDGA